MACDLDQVFLLLSFLFYLCHRTAALHYAFMSFCNPISLATPFLIDTPFAFSFVYKNIIIKLCLLLFMYNSCSQTVHTPIYYDVLWRILHGKVLVRHTIRITYAFIFPLPRLCINVFKYFR